MSNSLHSKGGDQWFLLRLTACHKWGHPGIDTGTHAVLGVGNESTLTKFSDDTKVGSEVDTSDGRPILQRDLDRLEEWVHKNCMQLNKSKFKVLHMVQNNQKTQYGQRSVWLGSSLVDTDLRVLADNKLNMDQQCAIAATKAKRILGCIYWGITSKDRHVIVSLCSVLVKLQLEYCVHFWSPQFKKDSTTLERAERRAKAMIKGMENLPCEETLKEIGLFSLEKRRLRENLIAVFQYLKCSTKRK